MMLNALSVAILLFAFALNACAQPEPGFVPLFDGQTLQGWTLVGGRGPGYIVRDGMIVCPKEGGGNLYTGKEYSDFVLRLEFRTEPGGNNGIGIRAPLEGRASEVGMEIQILDDNHPKYANLLPGQYCGSVYKVATAKRGFVKPAGEWNQMEISAIGPNISVKLNGEKVTEVNLAQVSDPQILAEHPGIRRTRGHIGFLGHGSLVEFRNIRLKETVRE